MESTLGDVINDVLAEKETPSKQKSLEQYLTILGFNYGYFWSPNLDQEPEENRLNREEFVKELLSLIKRCEEQSDIRTLETVAALLNGDSNQVEVVKGYVRNKLLMYKERSTPREEDQ